MVKKEFKFDFFFWLDKGFLLSLGLIRLIFYKIIDYILYLMYMCKLYIVKRIKKCFEKLIFFGYI